MEASGAAALSRKRPSARQEQQSESEDFCFYCKNEPAALLVSFPSVRKKQPLQERYCLLHFYTTSAVQSKPENVSVINEMELEKQMPAMQSLFADVFVELKQELSEEAARSFQSTSHDPLAIIGKLHKSSKKQQKPTPVRTAADLTGGGGFMEHVALPERLVRTQRAQAQKQKALVRRMEHASKTSATAADISSNSHTQRRKPTRKSIWNVMEDAAFTPATTTTTTGTTAASNTTAFWDDDRVDAVCSSCGSDKVACLSSSTNRNNDSTKGEIWGSGSRDEVNVRYQCESCGKTWNEQS